MNHPIEIEIGSLLLQGELFDSPAALAIWEALPIEAPFDSFGDEFYFSTSVTLPLDATARCTVQVGDIAYWPPESAIAIFFGPTPVSVGAEPMAASPVMVIGRVLGDAVQLGSQAGEVLIRIIRA